MTNENTNYVNYLIDLSQRGRKNAFFDLCEINLRTIFTLSYRLTSNYKLAQEVTLSSFKEALDEIKSYSNRESFVVWLMKITVKKTVHALNENEFVDKDFSEKRENLAEIERLILNLPAMERVVFVLHDLSGFSIKEIINYFQGYSEDDIKTKLLETRYKLMNGLGI